MSNKVEKELLRFTTCGSVDDGKSTLIGRLLFDTKNIFDDQLLALVSSSERKGLSEIDLSLLTDGLKAEREQGITIDVAYRYFSTSKRSLSLLIRQDTFSIPKIWSPVHHQQILHLF